MKTKITITLDQAKFWFNSRNEQLKKLALRAFGEDALENSFKDITTFKKACESLCLLQGAMDCVLAVASAAMFKLNIIRKALNLSLNLCFSGTYSQRCCKDSVALPLRGSRCYG